MRTVIARLLPLLAVPLLAGVALPGCGAGDVIDDQKAEIAVRFDVEGATGTKVESVTCPADVPASTGTRFTCHVVAESGADAVAELEITSEQGNLRMLSLKPAD